ncbi:hypothetical protein [Streptococcus canis]|uniref:hypothetical protein n=1 Tax=Streptococcus canis TaxID=1329 RepID=UPI001388BA81|nr:hypothetical protein [Streptococcus canis]MDW7798057.1 hypothetical protein [Streptococcus canis]GFG41729.1 hypothetical protein ScFU29_06330 [Streptococcus canis]
MKQQEKLRQQDYFYEFVNSLDAIIKDDTIAIVIELMGRSEPVKTYITRVLLEGEHVVTANKDLLALHGQVLVSLTNQQDLVFGSLHYLKSNPFKINVSKIKNH